MRILNLCGAMVLWPAAVYAQQDPVARLRELVPGDVSDQVIAIVREATAGGLPGVAIANRALEAQAKGKDEVVIAIAARDLRSVLAQSRDDLSVAGRVPDPGEIEAGAAAHELGVEAQPIRALASSTPSGRSLVVPLAVLGALVDGGLPAEDALQAVRARLAEQTSNTDLAAMPGQAGQMIAAGRNPPDLAGALGAVRPSGSAAASLSGPGGPPESVPSNNGSAGRSRRTRVPPRP